jgi:hypothetical protein
MRCDLLRAASVAALLLLPGLALADDLAAASDLDLVELTRNAVEEQDATRALDLLTEMQQRGTGIFAGAEKVTCEEVIPLPDEITDWRFKGAARQAYITAAKEIRLEDGRCGCLFSDFPFAKFTGDILGKEPSDLVNEDRARLDAFLALRQRETEERFRAFESLCRAM